MLMMIAKIIKTIPDCPYKVGTTGFFGGLDSFGVGIFEAQSDQLKRRIQIPIENVQIVGKRNE